MLSVRNRALEYAAGVWLLCSRVMGLEAGVFGVADAERWGEGVGQEE